MIAWIDFLTQLLYFIGGPRVLRSVLERDRFRFFYLGWLNYFGWLWFRRFRLRFLQLGWLNYFGWLWFRGFQLRFFYLGWFYYHPGRLLRRCHFGLFNDNINDGHIRHRFANSVRIDFISIFIIFITNIIHDR